MKKLLLFGLLCFGAGSPPALPTAKKVSVQLHTPKSLATVTTQMYVDPKAIWKQGVLTLRSNEANLLRYPYTIVVGLCDTNIALFDIIFYSTNCIDWRIEQTVKSGVTNLVLSHTNNTNPNNFYFKATVWKDITPLTLNKGGQ